MSKKKLSKEEMFQLQKQRAAKSKKKYRLGRRVYFTKEYFGYPKGVRATVVDTWPKTQIMVDRFDGRSWLGAQKNILNISQHLDKYLEICGKETDGEPDL